MDQKKSSYESAQGILLCRRLLAILIWSLLLPLVANAAEEATNGSLGQSEDADKVVYLNRGKNLLTRKGKVLELRSGVLTFESNLGQDEIPFDAIQELTTKWVESHAQADAAFQEFQYQQALDFYRTAFRVETRRWVKRRILAKVVRCQANTNRIGEACGNFSRLIKDDPNTSYFAAIPLQWEHRRPTDALQRQLAPWLAESQPKTNQLMAASWLLRSNRNKSAVRLLRQLGRDSWAPLRMTAISQLWRSEVKEIAKPRIAWWQQHLASMPITLRGGSYFLLGESFGLHDMTDQAALNYMRVPLQYPHQRTLANAALFRCGELLQEAGQTGEARACFSRLQDEAAYRERVRSRLQSIVGPAKESL